MWAYWKIFFHNFRNACCCYFIRPLPSIVELKRTITNQRADKDSSTETMADRAAQPGLDAGSPASACLMGGQVSVTTPTYVSNLFISHYQHFMNILWVILMAFTHHLYMPQFLFSSWRRDDLAGRNISSSVAGTDTVRPYPWALLAEALGSSAVFTPNLLDFLICPFSSHLLFLNVSVFITNHFPDFVTSMSAAHL